jgi:hypothetical protein
VAGTEPAAEVACLANGNTTEMGADTCCLMLALLLGELYTAESRRLETSTLEEARMTITEPEIKHTKHDQPIRFLDAIGIGLGIPQSLPFCIFGILDFAVGAVADEDWLASPLDDDLCSSCESLIPIGSRIDDIRSCPLQWCSGQSRP